VSASTESQQDRGGLASLFGREVELAELDKALKHAIDYHAPQLVLVTGAQGVGKTRLVESWIQRATASTDDKAVRVYRGRATERGPIYGIFAELLRSRFGLDALAPAQKAAEAFRAEAVRVFADQRLTEVLHFLGSFVGLTFPASPFLRAVEDDPIQHDRIARTVMRRFLELDAERSPLILAMDDVHFADDSSLELLRELAQALAGSAVVLVAVARPELLSRDPNFGSGFGEVTRLQLANLSTRDAEAMLRALLARAGALPGELLEHALGITSGNPAFLEELCRVLEKVGALDKSGAGPWRLDLRRALTVELPVSVEQAIAARIAGLSSDERLLLERGLTLGSVFWTGALVALARVDDAGGTKDDLIYSDVEELSAEISRMLNGLVEADYLLRIPDSTLVGEEEYAFKHNLEREHLERSLEPERARRYHLYGAQWLETRLPPAEERGEDQLEFLAQLYERGGSQRRAAQLFFAAGDRARARYAALPALSHYENGLRLSDPQDALARIDALHNIGDVSALLGKTDEAQGHFRAMLRDAWLLDVPGKGGAAHSRLGRILRRQGDFNRAYEHLQVAHRLFQRAGDRRGVGGTLDDIGRIHWLKGSYAAAIDLFHQALTLRREIGDARSISLSLNNLGLVHKDRGELGDAVGYFEEALDLRRQTGDKAGVASSLCSLGSLFLDRNESVRAHQSLQEALGVYREISDRVSEGDALASLAESLLRAGRPAEAIEHLEQAQKLARHLNDRLLLALCERTTAEACLALGQVEPAAYHASHAAELAEKTGSVPQMGCALRALAEVSAQGGFGEGSVARARAHYDQAIAIFERIGNRPELARTLDHYATYLATAGDGGAASNAAARAHEIYAHLWRTNVPATAAQS
jgi:tetratricopeptide (TPR) repeat protein